jgi:hypothetical protein
MAKIPEPLRELVYERAQYRCEYCQTQARIVIEMHVDHIVPQSIGGQTKSENLCLSCATCNNRKHDHQSGTDPETGEKARLFNPRTDTWREHFRWSAEGTELLGLSAIGRATIQRLDMNLAKVVAARSEWVAVGWHPPKT